MTSDLNLRIWGWAADSSGCQAYRLRFPFVAMIKARQNWGVGLGTIIPPEAREEADVVIAQRTCNEGPSDLWARWAAEGKKKLVYELDDDLWNVDPTNEKPYYFFANPKIRAAIIRNIQLAHVCTVSTAELAEVVYDMTGHQNIHVVPNAVPADLLDHEPEQNHDIGWGGSPTHHGDFAEVRSHLARYLKRNPTKTFHTIGSDYGEWMKLPSEQCHFTGWLKQPEDFFRAIDYRVGIAPLRNTMFNRSKSDIKYLELAALGIPTIASDVNPYRSIVHGETGLLVKQDHEWGRYLHYLAENPDERQRLGANAKEYVRNHRTTDHTAELWIQAIES
jgi:glycosyltransferase involved in cell wall biosynthesis